MRGRGRERYHWPCPWCALSPHCPYIGPARRFYRVCDKLQSAIVNPSASNPLNTEFVDYDNPSMSSDDALAHHTSGSPNGEGLESSEVMTPHTNGAGDPSLTDDSASDISDAESVPGTE